MVTIAQASREGANDEFKDIEKLANKKRKVNDFARPLLAELQLFIQAIADSNADEDSLLGQEVREIRTEMMSLARALINDKKLDSEARDVLIEIISFTTGMVKDAELDAAKVQANYLALLTKLDKKYDDILTQNNSKSRALGYIVSAIGIAIGIGLIVTALLPIFPVALFSVAGILFTCGILGGAGIALTGLAIVTKRESNINNKADQIIERWGSHQQVLLRAHSIFKAKHNVESKDYPPMPPLRTSTPNSFY